MQETDFENEIVDVVAEDSASWSLYKERALHHIVRGSLQYHHLRRNLKKDHSNKRVENDNNDNQVPLLTEEEEEYLSNQERAQKLKSQKQLIKDEKKRHKHRLTMLQDPGIANDSFHAMIIDAGSTGSRLHLFEFAPRTLRDEHEVNEAVQGRKLSIPTTDTRWTERLSPGLSTFSSIKNNSELEDAVDSYLQPLLEFAKTVLHSKTEQWNNFPIYLKATAGLRTLDSSDRLRIIAAVRNSLSKSGFKFEPEFARTISGEEEAVFGWAGVNFLTNHDALLQSSSRGTGTVIETPKQTVGALDLGGASTQVGFFDPNQNIMANLFKLQIGASKHWNIYGHSYLYFGINEAYSRLNSRLAFTVYPPKNEFSNANFTTLSNSTSSKPQSVAYSPCLPGKSLYRFSSRIHFSHDPTDHETWHAGSAEPLEYTTILRNDYDSGDFGLCLEHAKTLLHQENHEWCKFAHPGECSFAGAYQPPIPRNEKGEQSMEFVAFSNYQSAWQFLQLPARSSVQQLYDGAQRICSMSVQQLQEYNIALGKDSPLEQDDSESLLRMCFQTTYAYTLLHHGYGFQLDDHVTAVKTLNGHKVGWALGSMLYEINTLPWEYKELNAVEVLTSTPWAGQFVIVSLFSLICITAYLAIVHKMFGPTRPRKSLSLDPESDSTKHTPLGKSTDQSKSYAKKLARGYGSIDTAATSDSSVSSSSSLENGRG